MTKKIKIGISACLLGEKVRYDGQDKASPLCIQILSQDFEFQGFCPEVAIGLGVPRSTIHLTRSSGAVRVVGTDCSDLDVTEELFQYGQLIARQAVDQGLCGYLLKARSPSCAKESAELVEKGNVISRDNAGMFVRGFLSHCPALPIEEEELIHSVDRLENFYLRTSVYSEWLKTTKSPRSNSKLLSFHKGVSLLLKLCGVNSNQKLDRYFEDSISDHSSDYIELLMSDLKGLPSAESHPNGLRELYNRVKHTMEPQKQNRVLKDIEAIQRGEASSELVTYALAHELSKSRGDDIENTKFLNLYCLASSRSGRALKYLQKTRTKT